MRLARFARHVDRLRLGIFLSRATSKRASTYVCIRVGVKKSVAREYPYPSLTIKEREAGGVLNLYKTKKNKR